MSSESPCLQQNTGGRSGVEEADLLVQDAAEVSLPEPIGLPDACAVMTRGLNCHEHPASGVLRSLIALNTGAIESASAGVTIGSSNSEHVPSVQRNPACEGEEVDLQERREERRNADVDEVEHDRVQLAHQLTRIVLYSGAQQPFTMVSRA